MATLVGGTCGLVTAAVSEGAALLDLEYCEDSVAEVDLNVVGTPRGGVVEVQGTAEGAPIDRVHLDQMIDLALGAMPALAEAQRQALRTLDIDIDRLLA